jgi:hypothetical protein
MSHTRTPFDERPFFSIGEVRAGVRWLMRGVPENDVAPVELQILKRMITHRNRRETRAIEQENKVLRRLVQHEKLKAFKAKLN